MITVRKGGKLPGPVIGVDYALEYGTARMELRPETVTKGARVLVIDDVLATGGTASASISLIEQAGATVEAICMLLELSDLGGRASFRGVRWTRSSSSEAVARRRPAARRVAGAASRAVS